MTVQSTQLNNVFTRLKDVWLLVAALAVLYVPTYFRLATEVWQQSQSFHGALFFLLTIFIIWSQKNVFFLPAKKTHPIAGASIIVFGLLLFIIGRSQDFFPLEVLSQLPVFVGVLLMVKGLPTLRALWFPIAFILFLVPLPGSLMDAVLMPLKQFVSMVVDHGLFALGYPIARNGVILTIGSYQLLIADACAGLNSIIALSGIGFAFIYLADYSIRWQIALLVASVLPIALLANVLRVTFLTLITYYFGDAMGQRFHDIAGIVEVVLALGAFFFLDWLLRFSVRKKTTVSSQAKQAAQSNTDKDVITKPFMRHVVVGTLAVIATGLSIALTPKANSGDNLAVDLEQVLPKQFGDWKSAPAIYTMADVAPNRDGSQEREFYDQTALRTYRGPDGTTVMLAVAWGKRQSQEVKIHRPELCYTAQGFKVTDKQSTTLEMENRTIPITRMVTRNGQRVEPVTYWIRLGDTFSRGPVETRLTILKQGLLGNIPDGILVRVSTVSQGSRELKEEFAIQQAFLKDLLGTMSNDGKAIMVGNPVAHKVAVR